MERSEKLRSSGVNHNISTVADHLTARTCLEAAQQRAANLSELGAKNVLELCVGPSLSCLETAYSAHGIQVRGNDLDPRWAAYYPAGRWIIGDALTISYENNDALVFAPPLSRGCSGQRQDALMIDQVFPRYTDFIDRIQNINYDGLVCLVLPARSLATQQDRQQLHQLLNNLYGRGITFCQKELKVGRRGIRKYIDLYFSVRN